MYLLNKGLVENYIEQELIKIENFEKNNLFSTFYYFRLGNSASVWDREKQKYNKIRLDNNIESNLIIPPNGYALIKSFEKFSLSPKIYATIGQISDLPSSGLQLNCSPTIDPLFTGYLELGLVNILNREAEIPIHSDIGKIVFYDIGDTPIKSIIGEKIKTKFKRRENLDIPESIEEYRNIGEIRNTFQDNARRDV